MYILYDLHTMLLPRYKQMQQWNRTLFSWLIRWRWLLHFHTLKRTELSVALISKKIVFYERGQHKSAEAR